MSATISKLRSSLPAKVLLGYAFSALLLVLLGLAAPAVHCFSHW